MKKYLVQFFYTEKPYSEEVIYSTKYCIRPRLTNEYKFLNEMLDNDQIFSFGYKKGKYVD
jgi:hypothetical protein